MEVVSTSHLVSSEIEKQQQLVIFKPWLGILLLYDMNWWEAKREPMHVSKHEAIRSFMMAELKAHPKNDIYTKQQNQNRPAISWKKNIVLF